MLATNLVEAGFSEHAMVDLGAERLVLAVGGMQGCFG